MMIAAVPSVAAVAAVAAAAPTQARALTLADLRKTVSVSSPQISPDGQRVAIVVGRNDYNKDRAMTDIVLVDVRTRAARTLLTGVRQFGMMEWSPDGSRLAYVAQEPREEPPTDESAPAGEPKEPQTQLFILPMNGGQSVQLTHEAAGVGDFDWRPDGRSLAYVRHTEPPNKAEIDAHADEFEVTDEPWTAQEAPTPDQLYQIDASGHNNRRIGSGQWSVGGGFTYSAGGRYVFVTRITGNVLPYRYLARELVRIEVSSGKTIALKKLSQTQEDPFRSASGRIAFGFSNPHGSMQTEVALAAPDGSYPHSVTFALNRNVGEAAFLPHDTVLIAANDETRTRLFAVSPAGHVKILPLGSLNETAGLSASRDGTIAFAGNAPDRPSELFLLRPGATAPRRLTDYNAWIERYRLGTPHTIAWRTFDGLQADGVVITPPGWHSGTRSPLVLYIHGGPTSASTTSYSGFAQLLAAHGWLVFEPNYRGSDNLGLVFARTTVPRISSVPGRDIEAGVTRVIAQYGVDAKRVAVSGWSEGGLMTSWLITHDRRWRAAVSGAAVNDWVQYHDMTDAKDFTAQFIGPSPWTSAAQLAFYREESPLSYASNVRTPTLILSDAGDYRVPTPLSYEFYHEIRATGTPVQFVIYPVIGHFPQDPVRIEDICRRWQNWLTTHLR
ncbi:MAG TPA: S9 family peptidase [Candidatus Baltobacteraceae bacterium]|jgi:dipeptidyl aminopeptidase/acylaminoacyl peptidase|nr:S9 family peptidase [Candidatus Baltobacteraceae bacterium]